jgi:hypothetical protein
MKRSSAAKRAFDAEGPLLVVGHIWQFDGAGVRRYIVRRYRESGRSTLSELHYVERGADFCLACLSTDVDAKFYGVGGTPPRKFYRCRSCEAAWWVLPA